MEKEIKKGRRSPLLDEIYGILFLGAGIFLFVSLFSFDPKDPSFNRRSTKVEEVINLGGTIGSYLSDSIYTMFGFSGLLIPLFFIFIAVLFFRKRVLSLPKNLGGLLLLIFFLAPLLHLTLGEVRFKGEGFYSGGIIGLIIGNLSVRYLNRVGAYILLTFLLLLSIVIAFGIEVSRYFVRFLLESSRLIYGWSTRALYYIENRASSFIKTIEGVLSPAGSKEARVKRKDTMPEGKEPMVMDESMGAIFVDAQGSARGSISRAKEISPVSADKYDTDKGEEEITMGEEGEKDRSSSVRWEDLPLPSLNLLDEPSRRESHEDERVMAEKLLILEKRLREYGVDGKIIATTKGPIITMYEFEPAPGVKVNKIINLSDDIALSMKSSRVRIVAPIPGKSVVGIEIPNDKKEVVYLKEILSSKEFKSSNATLPLPLGKDTEGRPVVIDLARMPHLLIGGTTGSGKSIFINSAIQAFLFSKRPDEVRILLVDPKMLEFTIYEGIPHLLMPVITKPKKAALALRWAVEEMMARYRVLAKKGSRNIKNYNDRIEEEWQDAGEVGRPPVALAFTEIQRFGDEDGDIPLFRIPYVVIVIDELADLMMVSAKEVQDSIIRLAQMARAAGIHLLIATQRPSVDVITGLIKANFPARISFQVSSRTDSKIILDANGAESLLGDGDMLFLPPGTSKLKRIHGAFVSEGEIKRVVSFIKRYGEPLYVEGMLDILKGEDEEEEVIPPLEERDEKYEEAIKIAGDLGQISISMLQRRLGIGYNRAARIVEKMEEEGLVGPSDGSKPRDVYISRIAKRDEI